MSRTVRDFIFILSILDVKIVEETGKNKKVIIISF